MTRTNPLRVLLPLTALLTLAGCQAAADLLREPAPTDPNDGYDSYAQAGVSTVMDYGPKQNTLLAQYKELTTEHTRLQKEKEALASENANLKQQLSEEHKSVERETATRAQIEAHLQQARQRLNEQESMILALRIEKAKAEQTALLLQIEVAEASLAASSRGVTEATAMPPANR
jgi:predicted RNase H-like nuclease (RuvC/YqgF family)